MATFQFNKNPLPPTSSPNSGRGSGGGGMGYVTIAKFTQPQASGVFLSGEPDGTHWFYNYEIKDWEYDANNSLKDMWNGKYDGNGNKIIKSIQGHPDLLFYQGYELQLLKMNGERESWEAVSGVLDDNDKIQIDKQEDPEIGPIPEGMWYANLENAHSMSDAMDPIDFTKWLLKFKSTGYAFINLSPADVQTTRDGFSIHGGIFKGSAGCIDLTWMMADFYQAFIEYDRNLLLNVNYSNYK